MTTRMLSRDEWATKLAGTELEAAVPYLDGAQVVVVEDGETVVGCWALIPYVHVEGVWIAPAHRGRGSVARRLLSGMRRAAQAMGVSTVMTAAISDDVRELLAHLGATKLPGEHYALPVG